MNTNFNQTGTKSNKKPVINKSELANEKEPTAKKAETVKLRELPKHVVETFTTDVVGGVLDGFTRQLLGQPIIGIETHPSQQVSGSHEALMWKKKFQNAERRRQEERSLLLEKQRQTEQRVVAIRQELQVQMTTFTREMVSWAREVDIVSFQAPADPGIYHQNFFENLLSFIKNLRQRINNSRLWLKMHNAKAKKKQGLWALAQKKNTYNQEILYSGERAVSMAG